jgi:hypothetical protein
METMTRPPTLICARVTRARRGAIAKLANYASTNLAQIGQRWHRFLLNRRWFANTAQLTPSELQRMTRDVGLDERDLHTRGCNHPGPTELMPQRLKLLGLDPDYIRHALPAPYRDFERVCSHCRSWRRCARDMTNEDVQSGMDSYCLNAATIDALTVEPANS